MGMESVSQDEQGPGASTASAVDPSIMAKLAALFGKGGQTMPEPMPTGMGSAAPDSAQASAGPGASSAPGASPVPAEGGIMEALRNLFQFFNAKPGSASDEGEYQKDLTDAGMAPGDTGIGR